MQLHAHLWVEFDNSHERVSANLYILNFGLGTTGMSPQTVLKNVYISQKTPSNVGNKVLLVVI